MKFKNVLFVFLVNIFILLRRYRFVQFYILLRCNFDFIDEYDGNSNYVSSSIFAHFYVWRKNHDDAHVFTYRINEDMERYLLNKLIVCDIIHSEYESMYYLEV